MRRRRAWGEDEPRTIDLVLNLVLWLCVASCINMIGISIVLMWIWSQ